MSERSESEETGLAAPGRRELASREPRPRTIDADLLRQLDEERDEPLPLRKYFYLLLRRRWLILAVTAAAVLAMMLQVFTTTPLYRAFATVQIDPESPKVLPYEPALESTRAPSVRGEYLETQARKLQTRTLAERVVERLDLTAEPQFSEPVRRGFFVDRYRDLMAAGRKLLNRRDRSVDERVYVNRLLNNLGVHVLRNTRLVEVSFTSPDPELSAAVVNAVVDEFIEQSLESRYRATTKVTEFLSEQLEGLKSSVERSEEELIEYARASDIVSVNERETVDVQKLADLTDELTRVESELIELRARYQAVEAATPESFPGTLSSPAIVRLESELSQERRRLAGLRAQHGREWPAVKELGREIAELEEQLAAEKRSAIDEAREEYRVALDRYRRLVETVAEQRRTVDRLNSDSIEYDILEREVETNKQLYEGLLQRLKEAGVSAGLSWSNIHLVDKAAPPRRPAFPRRSLALVVGLMLGLALGVGAALLLDALDDTFASSDEVAEALRLPALGIIPVLADQVAQGRRGRRSPGKALRRRREAAPAPQVIAYEKTQNWQDPAWEAYRSLRTSLLLSHSGSPPQSILVTSALPGEGKSTTVANTAIVLAQTGARTLILDLDLRKPTMADIFGVSAEKGMSMFLSGNSDLRSLVCETGFPNLSLIPAGPAAPNPAELLGSQHLGAGIQLLQEIYDHILIDTPPCLEITDALVTSPHVDGLLLVVRAGRTPKEVVRKASDRVLRIGGKLLGVLVNAVDVRRTDYGYYYGYYRSYYRSYHARSGGPPAEERTC